MDELYRDSRIPNLPHRIHYIQRENDVGPAVRHLLKFDMLGFDLETYHSVDRHIPAFDPTNGAKSRLSQWATPEGDAFVFDHYNVAREYMYMMFPNRFLLVGQNIKFEFKYLMYELGIYDFGPCWDTMVAEQVMAKGAVAGKEKVWVGLDQLAYRHLHVRLPKDEQASDWYMNELSTSQVEYAARDAQVVLPIYQIQRDKIFDQSQVRVAELEFDTIAPLALMENTGMRLNPDKWLAVCDETAKELQTVKEELWGHLGSQGTLFGGVQTINLNSQPKIIQAFENIGVTLPVNKDKSVTLSSKLLKGIEDHPAVRAYIKYSTLAKSAQSYGPNWLDKINPFDGRMHYEIFQIGAETGRMAGKKPNMMQIKKDDRYRGAFEAEEGWVFVDADYSQCELRILAELCRDPNLLRAFDQDHDLHKFSAHLIFNCLLEAVTDIQRAIAKNLNFGIVYGIGVMKFATDAGIPHEEAERIMNYYLRVAYPHMGSYLETRAKEVLWTMEAATMTGRIRKYTADLRDKEQKAAVQRNAKNLPIQGTNADITKRALALCYDRFKGNRDVRMLLPIHDEIICEARGTRSVVEQAEWDLRDCMMRAEQEYLKRVPCKVDCNITLEWSKDPKPEQIKAARDLYMNN